MKANTASLLGLPVEIRLQILEYLLGQEVQQSRNTRDQQQYCIDCTQRTFHFCPNHFVERECLHCDQKSGVTIWRPPPGQNKAAMPSPLFVVNRKFSKEALTVFYRLNHFILHDSGFPPCLESFRDTKKSCWSLLRSLTIFVPWDPTMYAEEYVIQISTGMPNLSKLQILHIDGSYQTQDPLACSVSHAVYEASAEKCRLMLVLAAWLELRHPNLTTSRIQIIPIMSESPFHPNYEMDIKILISARTNDLPKPVSLLPSVVYLTVLAPYSLLTTVQDRLILDTEQIRCLDVEILHGQISDIEQFLRHPTYAPSSIIEENQPVVSRDHLTLQELRTMFKYTDREPLDFTEFNRAYRMREKERYKRKGRNWKRNVEKRRCVKV